VLVAVLGDVLFFRWWRSRHEPTPESGLPVAVVYLHGLFAVATVVLVLLVGLGVGVD
jgi:manganese efflux pump family protein